MLRWTGVTLLSLLVAGCGMPVSLDYAATWPILTAGAGNAVQVLQVVDQRAVDDPAVIGTVRGGYGNPLRRYKAERLLGGMVKRSFEDALAAPACRPPRARRTTTSALRSTSSTASS